MNARAVNRCATIGNRRCADGVERRDDEGSALVRWMRWLRGLGVAALLAAPVVVVLVVAWPAAGVDTVDQEEDGGAIAVGERIDGVVTTGGVTRYELVGTGEEVTVGVVGNGFDSTLTVVDVESGDQLGFVDDANGVDPVLVVDLEQGRTARIEVRGYSGQTGAFTVYVDEGATTSAGGGAGGAGGAGPGRPPPAPPGTIVGG